MALGLLELERTVVTLCKCWDSNPRSLREQPVLVTVEVSCQPVVWILKNSLQIQVIYLLLHKLQGFRVGWLVGLVSSLDHLLACLILIWVLGFFCWGGGWGAWLVGWLDFASGKVTYTLASVCKDVALPRSFRVTMFYWLAQHLPTIRQCVLCRVLSPHVLEFVSGFSGFFSTEGCLFIRLYHTNWSFLAVVF